MNEVRKSCQVWRGLVSRSEGYLRAKKSHCTCERRQLRHYTLDHETEETGPILIFRSPMQCKYDGTGDRPAKRRTHKDFQNHGIKLAALPAPFCTSLRRDPSLAQLGHSEASCPSFRTCYLPNAGARPPSICPCLGPKGQGSESSTAMPYYPCAVRGT